MVLGITGISGSGKHTAAEYFRRKGWVVLDTDTIAHHLYRPYTSAWKEISEEFGEKILNQDDTINRVRLGQIVFNSEDPAGAKKALKKLDKIVHPHIRRYLENEIYMEKKKGVHVVIVSALWSELEKGISDKFLLVKAEASSRCKRIASRDGIPENMYKMRIKNQNEPENPDFVVENNGTISELYKKIDEILDLLAINNQ